MTVVEHANAMRSGRGPSKWVRYVGLHVSDTIIFVPTLKNKVSAKRNINEGFLLVQIKSVTIWRVTGRATAANTNFLNCMCKNRCEVYCKCTLSIALRPLECNLQINTVTQPHVSQDVSISVDGGPQLEKHENKSV